MRRARSAGAAREAPRLVAARDLEPPPQARGADAERADGVIRMTEIWPCVRTWNPSIGLHACCCVPSAPARNRLLASAMNQTTLPLSGRGTIPLARYRRAGRPRPKTRMVRPLPNTAPFHKASSRWYRAGTRPIETVSLHGRRSSPAAAHFPREPPYPVPRRTRSEARFCFAAGNCDTACLTPRLTDRGIALAFACPISRSCATAARSACVTAIYPARKAGMASRARDSRCPTPVYPMPIRTAPTVNFVAPDATRQGRSLSSLLHFARRLSSPSRRNAPPPRSGSWILGDRWTFPDLPALAAVSQSAVVFVSEDARRRKSPVHSDACARARNERRRRKSREGKDGQVD